MNVRNMGVLGKRRRNSQGARSFHKTQRRRRNIVATDGFMDEVPEPRQADAQLIHRRCAQRLRVSYIHNLGTAGVGGAKTGEEYIRHTLEILIKEIVAREQPQVRVVVYAA